MKRIGELYLEYLELTLIGMLVGAFLLTLAAGILYGDIALFPAMLANTSLIVIVSVALGRRKALAEHPEIETKPFKESRLFWFAFENKVALVLKPFKESRLSLVVLKTTVGLAVMILVLGALGATGIVNHLLSNQAIVAAGSGIPATFFNRALIIEVIEISSPNNGDLPKVTAVLHSEGYPDMKIENQIVGYETTYTSRDRFKIRIVEVTSTYAKFFVERIETSSSMIQDTYSVAVTGRTV